MRQCTRCLVHKSEIEFSYHSLHKEQLLKTCKLCNEKQTIYRGKTREKNKLSRNKYYKNNKEKIVSVRNKRFNTIEGRLTKLLSTIKYDDQNCDLDIEYLLELYNKQNGKCALTNIKMIHTSLKDNKFRTNPFTISIDRIDSTLPHIKTNTRLVCVVVKFALNEWGESIFKQVCEAYINNCKQ